MYLELARRSFIIYKLSHNIKKTLIYFAHWKIIYFNEFIKNHRKGSNIKILIEPNKFKNEFNIKTIINIYILFKVKWFFFKIIKKF